MFSKNDPDFPITMSFNQNLITATNFENNSLVGGGVGNDGYKNRQKYIY